MRREKTSDFGLEKEKHRERDKIRMLSASPRKAGPRSKKERKD